MLGMLSWSEWLKEESPEDAQHLRAILNAAAPDVWGEKLRRAITRRDLLVVGSGSGESVVPAAVAGVAKKHGARVAHIGSNPDSSLRPLTDTFVRIPVRTRLNIIGELPSQQIMTSLFEQTLYILGDAITLMIMHRQGLSDLSCLWQRHANLE